MNTASDADELPMRPYSAKPPTSPPVGLLDDLMALAARCNDLPVLAGTLGAAAEGLRRAAAALEAGDRFCGEGEALEAEIRDAIGYSLHPRVVLGRCAAILHRIDEARKAAVQPEATRPIDQTCGCGKRATLEYRPAEPFYPPICDDCTMTVGHALGLYRRIKSAG